VSTAHLFKDRTLEDLDEAEMISTGGMKHNTTFSISKILKIYSQTRASARVQSSPLMTVSNPLLGSKMQEYRFSNAAFSMEARSQELAPSRGRLNVPDNASHVETLQSIVIEGSMCLYGLLHGETKAHQLLVWNSKMAAINSHSRALDGSLRHSVLPLNMNPVVQCRCSGGRSL
jgi:hypothetical protein